MLKDGVSYTGELRYHERINPQVLTILQYQVTQKLLEKGFHPESVSIIESTHKKSLLSLELHEITEDFDIHILEHYIQETLDEYSDITIH